jgi:homopolymeric O-antigen transport system permease protein
MTAAAAINPQTVIIEPRRRLELRLSEVWEYRDLLYFLIWRDIKVRYKQTALGALWAILQPLLATIVFTLFFGRLAKIPSDGVPYPVFAYVALVPWQLFAYSLTESSNSLVTNQNLIRKVYFPRLVIPLSAVVVGLVDFAIAFLLVIAMLFKNRIVPGASIALLPIFLLFAVATALAIGFWLSALNIQYRDIRYTIPFLTQVWMLATPVAYPSSLIPERWRSLYGLNPMAGVVEGFRWALLGKAGNPGPLIWVSAAVVLLLLISGLAYFRRMESSFADIV